MSNLQIPRMGLVVLLSLVTVCSHTALASPDTEGTPDIGTDAAKLAKLSKRWREAMKKLDVPGMAVVVVRDGRVIFQETLGERDPVRHLPVTEDTAFYIASATKSFVAMAVMQLVEEGSVELDAPVQQYLPRFQLANARTAKNIQVKDLLCHRKGINSWPIAFLESSTGEIDEERYYYWLSRVTPTGQFQYSNLNYTLLGRIIEAVTGKDWKDVLRERIFEPLGMDEATAHADEMYARVDVAFPTDVQNGRIVSSKVRKTDRTMHAAGGVGASISDLARWLQVNLGKGAVGPTRLLSPENMARMHDLQARRDKQQQEIPGRVGVGYGYGWFLGTYRGERELEHGGRYAGSAIRISFMPDRRIGVAAVVNSESPLAELVILDVYDTLLGRQPLDLVPHMVKMRSHEQSKRREVQAKYRNPAVSAGALSLPPKEYTGTYTDPLWGTIRIELRGGRLQASIGDLPLLLGAGDRDAFRALVAYGDREFTGRFAIEDDKVTAIVGNTSDPDVEVHFEKQ